jgi:hypothetical protein
MRRRCRASKVPGVTGRPPRNAVADRQSKRFHASLLLPGRCPLYVRNHCYTSTRSDTWRDKEKTARRAAFPQPGAVFAGGGRPSVRTRVGEADGFTERSSCPSHPPLTSADALRGVIRCRRRPLCVRGPRIPWPLKSTDGARTARVEAVTLTVRPRLWATTCRFSYFAPISTPRRPSPERRFS